MRTKKFYVSESEGAVEMVERWCIVHERTRTIPYPRSIDWSVDSFEKGEERIAAIKRNNREKDFLEHYPGGLTLAKWWCYPKSHYPFESVEPLPTWIVIDLTADPSGRIYDENLPNMLTNWKNISGFTTLEDGEKRFNFHVQLIKEANDELFGVKCQYITLPTISGKERDEIRDRLMREYQYRKSVGLDASDLRKRLR